MGLPRVDPPRLARGQYSLPRILNQRLPQKVMMTATRVNYLHRKLEVKAVLRVPERVTTAPVGPGTLVKIYERGTRCIPLVASSWPLIAWWGCMYGGHWTPDVVTAGTIWVILAALGTNPSIPSTSLKAHPVTDSDTQSAPLSLPSSLLTISSYHHPAPHHEALLSRLDMTTTLPHHSMLSTAADKNASNILPATSQQQLSLCLSMGASMLPAVDKVATGGEDAFFLLPEKGAMGVADGVGGWASKGVDPALYSRGLMQHCQDATCMAVMPEELHPRRLLHTAQASNRVQGSATACVAVLGVDGQLQVANLGDSGLMLVRDGKTVLKTQPQQRRFNQPFQLAHTSMHRGTHTAQRDADSYQVQLQAGDIIVMGSDGLWDNMSEARILDEVWPGGPPQADAGDLAQVLANKAHERASDPYAITPWNLAVAEAGLGEELGYAGGKMDDCTVLVAHVQSPPAIHHSPPIMTRLPPPPSIINHLPAAPPLRD